MEFSNYRKLVAVLQRVQTEKSVHSAQEGEQAEHKLWFAT